MPTMSPLVLVTARLDLIPSTVSLLDAELVSSTRLAQARGSSVAPDW
jgi:hypothetical protein